MNNNTKIAALAALLCLGAAAPALAAWDSLGAVNVEARRGPWNGPGGTDRDVRNFDLGGPVERLALRAERNDVNCRSIVARYGNDRGPGRRGFGNNNGNGPGFGNRDRRDQIFSGVIRQGRTVNIDMPGRGQDLDGLIFNCEVMGRRDAVIRVSAEVGRYRDQWMSGPNWRGQWSRMFNWTANTASNAVNNWQRIGTESFEGRGDGENVFAGFRGRHVDSIALMPVNADARCNRVEASFDNGRRQTLNLRNGEMLRRGTYTQIDLPGNYRNLDNLYLRCSAINAPRVEIQIFTSH